MSLQSCDLQASFAHAPPWCRVAGVGAKMPRVRQTCSDCTSRPCIILKWCTSSTKPGGSVSATVVRRSCSVAHTRSRLSESAAIYAPRPSRQRGLLQGKTPIEQPVRKLPSPGPAASAKLLVALGLVCAGLWRQWQWVVVLLAAVAMLLGQPTNRPANVSWCGQ